LFYQEAVSLQSRDDASSVSGWEVAAERKTDLLFALSFRIRCHEGFSVASDREAIMKKENVLRLTNLAFLTALEIVLARFLSISAWNIKIGFDFIPIVIAAILYGPIAGGIVGASGDFIGAVLFPIGPYFPGFTLTAFCVGVIYGLFLHRRQTIKRIVCTILINQLILSLLVNTLWISILYNVSFHVLLPVRLVQCAVLIPIQIILIGLVAKSLIRYWKYVPVAKP